MNILRVLAISGLFIAGTAATFDNISSSNSPKDRAEKLQQITSQNLEKAGSMKDTIRVMENLEQQAAFFSKEQGAEMKNNFASVFTAIKTHQKSNGS